MNGKKSSTAQGGRAAFIPELFGVALTLSECQQAGNKDEASQQIVGHMTCIASLGQRIYRRQLLIYCLINLLVRPSSRNLLLFDDKDRLGWLWRFWRSLRRCHSRWHGRRSRRWRYRSGSARRYARRSGRRICRRSRRCHRWIGRWRRRCHWWISRGSRRCLRRIGRRHRRSRARCW